MSAAVHIALDVVRGQKVRLSRGPSKNNLGYRSGFTRVKFRRGLRSKARWRVGPAPVIFYMFKHSNWLKAGAATMNIPEISQILWTVSVNSCVSINHYTTQDDMFGVSHDRQEGLFGMWNHLHCVVSLFTLAPFSLSSWILIACGRRIALRVEMHSCGLIPLQQHTTHLCFGPTVCQLKW